MSAILKEPNLDFRPMQEADLPDIMEIEIQCYSHPWTDAIFRDCMRAGYCCWVGEREDVIEGYGVVSAAAGESHLLNLCVRPAAQGQGIGRKMMDCLIGIAREHKAEVMFLEVRPSNESACHLYRTMDFNELGTRKDYYPCSEGREDALIFARTL